MQEGVLATQIAGGRLRRRMPSWPISSSFWPSASISSRFSSEGISEFFVGGRRMNRFVVALSAVVSGRSAWLLLGVTGMAYAMGASALWAVSGYTAAELILFLTYARRLRLFSEKHDCITLPDFFAARFGDEDGRLRLTLALVILIFMVVYVASQFVGGGKAMAASFGLTQWSGCPDHGGHRSGLYHAGWVPGREPHRHPSGPLHDGGAGDPSCRGNHPGRGMVAGHG